MPDAAKLLLATSPANLLRVSDSPWVPTGEGQWIRLLRILPNSSGYVAQLKLNPGVTIPPHRHTGTVQALNLQGMRKLHTGETVGPGDYVFEPVGNVDTWKAVGDEPLIVLIQVEGDVEYLDGAGNVVARYNADGLEVIYRRYCESVAHPYRDVRV